MDAQDNPQDNPQDKPDKHGPGNPRRYIGRFAPSPTGPLHFGSLLAAIGSFLQARTNDGAWLVRIEDIDPPREVQGAAKGQLEMLARFGMFSDQPVVYQSRSSAGICRHWSACAPVAWLSTAPAAGATCLHRAFIRAHAAAELRPARRPEACVSACRGHPSSWSTAYSDH